MRRPNFILLADSYKASHFEMYPPGTERVYSYIEARQGGRWPASLFFGLQAFLMEYMQGPVVTQHDIEEAAEFWAAHGLPFNRSGWQTILDEYGGRLPIEIRAVPEGSVVPTGNALVTVENTDHRFFWLTSYVETALLRGVWYPTTVATNSLDCKRVIWHWLERTADDPAGAGLEFKLHDFGGRGVSSRESAELGGMAHLVNFRGTDTPNGILAARRYYREPMAGFSIPAMEHSTVISWGRDREEDAYRNVIRRFGRPGALVACVSDSYDLTAAVRDIWCGSMRDEVLASGCTLVVRPDSGDPPEVVLRTVEQLKEGFGADTNRKGYRVLRPAVRVIQGDGMSAGPIDDVLASLHFNGWSAENPAFGMGGALLQGVGRDDLRFAMKPSHVTVGGDGRGVSKDPADDRTKASKQGRFSLVRHADRWRTWPQGSTVLPDMLELVFRNGDLLRAEDFSTIRARAWQ